MALAFTMSMPTISGGANKKDLAADIQELKAAVAALQAIAPVPGPQGAPGAPGAPGTSQNQREFVGVTSHSWEEITGKGIPTMNSYCDEQFPGAKMCTSIEFLNSSIPILPDHTHGYVRPVITHLTSEDLKMDASGIVERKNPDGSHRSLSCLTHRASHDNWDGLIAFAGPPHGGASVTLDSCGEGRGNTAMSIACCALVD
jgi:hypothetical protein